MAQRRMFTKIITESDAFLDMPISSQLLYFHLAMNADDDGFVSSPKRVIRSSGCKEDDLSVLKAKEFILPFDTGVIVIKHWRMHNYIQNDRKHKTIHTSELESVVNVNGEYGYRMDTKCVQNVSKMDTEVRLGKVRLGKDSIDNTVVRVSRFTPPTLIECSMYFIDINSNGDEAERYHDYYTSNGWMVGKNKMKDWKAAARNWLKSNFSVKSKSVAGARRAVIEHDKTAPMKVLEL
jgi:hypothetical protein